MVQTREQPGRHGMGDSTDLTTRGLEDSSSPASAALAGWAEANPKEAAAFEASIPLGRIGDCENDIGEFVALLCSPEASYVNGQSIALDGGQANLG